MATIDYKQKIKDYMNSSEVDTLYKSMLNNLFPELAESEGEGIRKALLEMVHDTTGDSLWIDYNVHKEDALAWLEKQGGHAKFINGIQVGDKVTRNEDGVLVNLSQLNRVAKKDKKQGEQNPALSKKGAKGNEREIPISDWSEEDETRFESCIKILQTSDGYDTINAKWLKSIKDRVQPQPKRVWSEEDENMLGKLLDYCNLSIAYNWKGTLQANVWEQRKEWFKSLKERYTWKPSDEQMEILQYLCENSSHPNKKVMPTLKSLYQDLKKLMEK